MSKNVENIVPTIDDVEAEARKEIREQRMAHAKTQIMNHIDKIEKAKQVVKNLEREYEALKEEIQAGL